MKIINNFSTLKKDIKFDKLDLIFWKVSLYKYKENNYQLKLYCKSSDIQFLKEQGLFKLYDEIDTEFLDNFKEPLNINEEIFWSHRKLRCIEHEFNTSNEPFIYSDTDVICAKPIIIKETTDVLLWQKEGWKNKYVPMFRETYIPWKFISKPANYKLPEYLSHINYAYNCGIMYFKSKQLFKEYLNEYLAFCNNNPGKVFKKEHENILIACNAEQRILYGFLKAKKAKVQLILSGSHENGISKYYNHYFLIKSAWKKYNQFPDSTNKANIISDLYYKTLTNYTAYLNKKEEIK